jgi:HEPN domain-containing protein
MSAERVIANTLRLAQADLEAAKLLHAGKNRYAIYHCEQAAEKVIKAVLTSEGVHANIKHLLDDMVKQVPDANPLKALLKQVEHLAAYATTYRYASPTGNIKPAPDDATLEADIASVQAALSATAAAVQALERERFSAVQAALVTAVRGASPGSAPPVASSCLRGHWGAQQTAATSLLASRSRTAGASGPRAR